MKRADWIAVGLKLIAVGACALVDPMLARGAYLMLILDASIHFFRTVKIEC